VDHNKAKPATDLPRLRQPKLFPIHGFNRRPAARTPIEYKSANFRRNQNKIQSGYNLREITTTRRGWRFRSQTEKHELSHLYEAKIKNMGTPGATRRDLHAPPSHSRHVQVIQSKLGERIYDGACAPAGLPLRSFEYLESPGTPILPIGGEWSAIQENGAPRSHQPRISPHFESSE